ncbi:hypothetical protein BDW67DRAFT_183209 [Aspergillus spinulosporus]
MCFYQPNPPACACAFHQLIQPCPSATTYPPPEPSKNPNPLVKVCDIREFAKGVGMRICMDCQSKYAGMNNMGAGVGVGMGERLGYNETGGALKKDRARFMELAMERMVATATASPATPISETGTVFASSPNTSTGPKFGTAYGSSLIARRREPKTDSRRMVPYPNPVSKGQTAGLSPVSKSAKEAAKEIPTPTPTPMPNDLGRRKDNGENQGQVQECSQIMVELGKDPESQSLLLRYDPPKATVESHSPGIERRPTTVTAGKTCAEICDGKDDTVAEKNAEGVSDPSD